MEQYSYIEKLIAFCSLVVFIVPIGLLYNYIFPWEEGIETLNKMYPDQSYIEVGGSARWHSDGRTKIVKKYLVLPTDKIVELVKYNNNKIKVSRVNKYGIAILITAILAPLVMFIYVGFPYFRFVLKGRIYR